MSKDTDIFLIAEIGINHNGDLNIAKKLINAAAEAGFNAVKFQKRNVEFYRTKKYAAVRSKENPLR